VGPARPAPSATVRAGGALLLGLFALCVYRAATQAVSHDEALTWLLYLDHPFSTMFASWRANDHVLHTALAWLSVHAFGSTELALRLPALLGAALCLLALRRLARRACGDGPLHLLALVLLAANPLVLDLLVAARGYGLALALLLWGAIMLLEALDAGAAGSPRPGAWWRASLLLGLCVTANLAFAPAALGLLGAAWLAGPRGVGRLAALLLPGAALAAAVLVPPMLGVTREAFIVGVDRLSLTADTLLQPSLSHHPAAWLPDEHGALLRAGLLPAGRALAVLLLLLLLARCPRWLRRGGTVDADERALALLGGALLLSLLGLVLAHHVVGLLYPADRTGLYLLPLALLPALVLAQRGLSGRWRPVAQGALALLVAWGVLQLAELQADRFALWSLDAGARRTFETMEARQQRLPHRDVQLRVAYRVLAPAMQFYRETRGASWLAPVPTEWDVRDLDLDYLLVPSGNWGDVLAGDPERFNLLYEDPMTAVRLAVPKHRGR
jgi:hypothetical protein